MKVFRRIASVVVLLLGVAALLFALRSCAEDEPVAEEPQPTASPSPSPTLEAAKMGTTTIEESIKARLDEVSGRPTRIECPERVAQKVGTAFECDVFFDDEPETAAVATAAVEIDGPDGHFTWTSTPTSNQG